MPEANEGKTKRIVAIDAVRLIAKDDITAGDGAKHDVIPGKAVWATATTCNIFEFYKAFGLPLAYIGRDTDESFVAYRCRMIKLEVVVRGSAYGSYLKRNPNVREATKFDNPLVELYLKTSDRRWNHYKLPCDDPLMLVDRTKQIAELYVPNEPLTNGPFLRLPFDHLFEGKDEDRVDLIAAIAARAYRLLRTGFEQFMLDYVDFKLEFGIRPDGRLVIADVVDSDSGRLMKNGVHISKQRYRDGDGLPTVAEIYEHVADLTNHLPEKKEVVKIALEHAQNSYIDAFNVPASKPG